MKSKNLPFSQLDKNQEDYVNSKDYPTLADLMIEQNVSSRKTYMFHRRRDLDSLG